MFHRWRWLFRYLFVCRIVRKCWFRKRGGRAEVRVPFLCGFVLSPLNSPNNCNGFVGEGWTLKPCECIGKSCRIPSSSRERINDAEPVISCCSALPRGLMPSPSPPPSAALWDSTCLLPPSVPIALPPSTQYTAHLKEARVENPAPKISCAVSRRGGCARRTAWTSVWRGWDGLHLVTRWLLPRIYSHSLNFFCAESTSTSLCPCLWTGL